MKTYYPCTGVKVGLDCHEIFQMLSLTLDCNEALAFCSWRAYMEQLHAQRKKLKDVAAMLVDAHLSSLLHSTLACWRGVVSRCKQAEMNAAGMLVKREQR